MLSEIVFTYLTNGSLLSKKFIPYNRILSGHWYELSNQLNTAVISYASVCAFQAARFFPKFFQKIFKLIGIVLSSGTGGYERGSHHHFCQRERR